jgi:hypothetical protein
MGEPTHARFELRMSEFAAVDAAAGVIRGVSVISIGEAKGHGLQIDRTTLEQVQACAKSYQNGLKVKMSHGGDAGDIVGFLSAFRIEGDKLLADLTLLKSSRFRDYVIELASTIPDTFGLSIAFSGPVETKDKTRFARCAEIYSADLVSEPAANPTGLFEAKPAPASSDKPDENKNKTTITMEQKEQLAALQATIDALSARLARLETPAKPEDLTAKFEQVAELAAEKTFKAFAAKFGTPAAAPSAEATPPAPVAAKTFEVLVREHKDYKDNKQFAITDTVAKHAKEHADYLARVHKGGDVIVF